MGFSDELTKALTESRFVIGARGLEAPGGDKLSLLKNRVYAMGASSSPDLIFVTGVTDDVVTYRKLYNIDKELKIQPWIARDLISKGTRSYLSMYGRHLDSATKRSLEDLMDGGKGKPEKLADYKKIYVAVKSKMGGDPWYTAEKYGNVGEISTGIVEIATVSRNLTKIKKDSSLEVVKVANNPIHNV